MTAIARRDLGRVLVTGAGGFLGAAVVRHLSEEGVTVIAADVAGYAGMPASTGSAPLEPCDVTDAAEVERLVGRSKISTLLHCGAVSGPMVLADQPARIVAINTMGTANVLEAARRAGVARVVLCSTIDVYGSRQSGMVLEDAPLDPDTVYGASKAAAEQILLAYRREHGLDAIALRLSWIYGPGRVTATALEQLLRDGLSGRAARVDAHPAERTQYLHLDDAVRSLVCAASVLKTERAVFNATAGPGSTFGAVAATVQAVLPALRVDLVGSPPTGASIDGYDQTAAANDIGFVPRMSFEAGIRAYVEALRTASTSPTPTAPVLLT
ncbi:UDP-glucose 4-epimerase [Aureimonas sp. SA4125]|uniref:NAD-dependent epimerase/dehydratase family protein n=1 Tax=Aureimonas sp. SA4125 TaxID=2826993 RepID=UPI001CC5B3E2|nr:NAD(P)-dependent oxidoreductase [Aureimonas sp. SA4125]BDA83600.1 UDP-glucose 4-epimerase [Aureimonas sp. SA4125]